MKILISNDDGVHAIGIVTLATELAKIAEIEVIAPDRNRSGASNSLSVQIPVRIQQLSNGYYSVTGTPTDCVHLAVTGLFENKFDMVVSGINAGANLGDDIVYSGTVAAATEGGVLGLPSVAFSLVGKDPQKNYDTAAAVARQIIERLKKAPLPHATILNVNIPDVGIEELQGFEITRLGKRHPAQPAIKALDPRGYPVYWIGASGDEEDAGPGTDFHAIKENKVSITPIQLDMTNYTAFEKIKDWVSGLIHCKK
ncbi:MAG TPA: 5'/3'-nucleotidase SurE [Coxiellaceae bacterium]|nr:MAG: 5'/3'-nucleotidase SurE [Gammaproteobacteria bacterium RBG_16_37_9]HBC71992.1 5'/3'-nucleotidase SurE [Coxiellaceae bacterium]HBY56071.1 5'/3'-nucleotidase SurE [Coxiellaceae bacterium]